MRLVTAWMLQYCRVTSSIQRTNGIRELTASVNNKHWRSKPVAYVQNLLQDSAKASNSNWDQRIRYTKYKQTQQTSLAKKLKVFRKSAFSENSTNVIVSCCTNELCSEYCSERKKWRSVSDVRLIPTGNGHCFVESNSRNLGDSWKWSGWLNIWLLVKESSMSWKPFGKRLKAKKFVIVESEHFDCGVKH